jgi:ABC-2 type transport system permease protein
MVRFVRQRTRVIGAFATPLVFWLLLGSGLNRSFSASPTPSTENLSAPAVGYLQYFYPGTIVLILLFTAIFSTISVIEDRREGFMQGVLVAPIPRLAIVLGKVLGGASIATLQGTLFLLFWPLVGQWPGLGLMLAVVAVMFVLALGLTALGLCLAWPMDSTAAFHGIMNLFLMPMWFLSGAVFPLQSAPAWMRAVMWANPLTYGQAALSTLLGGGGDNPLASVSLPLSVSLSLMLTSTAVSIVLAALVVSGHRKGAGLP